MMLMMLMMLMKITVPSTPSSSQITSGWSWSWWCWGKCHQRSWFTSFLYLKNLSWTYDIGDDEDYIGNHGHHGSFPLQLRLAAWQSAPAGLHLRLEEPCNHRRHPPRHQLLLIFNHLCSLWHCYDHNNCHHHYLHRHLPTPQKCRHQKVFFLLKSQHYPICYLSR